MVGLVDQAETGICRCTEKGMAAHAITARMTRPEPMIHSAHARLGSTALATGRLERRLGHFAADVAATRFDGADEEGRTTAKKLLGRVGRSKSKTSRPHRETTGDGAHRVCERRRGALRRQSQRKDGGRNAHVSQSPDRVRMGINLGDIVGRARYLWRRGQCRGPARSLGRTRRDLRQPGGA